MKILQKQSSGEQHKFIPQIRQKNNAGLIISFLLMVGAPLILTTLYYLIFAVKVYETDAGVAVRKEAVVSEDNVGVSLGSASALAVFADSFIVTKYAKSRKAVEGVMKKVDIKAAFSKGGPDPLYWFSPENSIEQTVAYWKKMIDADFDASTGIITLKVRAFSSQDAVAIATELAKLLENLVAKLSEKSQKEAVRFAEAGLDNAIKALSKHREAMQKFRIENKIVDPTSEVANLNTLITTLSQELIKLKTERAVLRMTSKSNPKIRQLEVKISNTLSIIQEIKGGRGNFKHVSKLPEMLRSYEFLKNNYDIANQQYVKALETLGEANAAAILRQAHLYIFVPFSKPQSPIRPILPMDLLTVLLISLGIWGIYRLIK